MEYKRALITGGSGYFGEVLVKKLIEERFHCTIFDINEPEIIHNNKIVFIKGDIRNEKNISDALKNIDYVFHNVAQVPLSKNKKLFKQVNIDGTKNILKYSLKNNVKHFVYTSSSAVYGIPKNNPVSEKTVPLPGEAYGRAKLEGEKLVSEYSKKGLKSSIIRPRTILGHDRLGIFQILFEWIYTNKKIPVFDNGKNIYQFVHSDDLAEAIIKSIEIEQSSSFNVGAEKYCSMKETLEYLISETNSKSKIKSLRSIYILPLMRFASFLGLSPLGAYHSMMYGKSMYFDVSKSKNELLWKPKYSNKEMILESYHNYVKNREKIIGGEKERSLHKSPVKQGALKLLNYFI